MMGGDVLCVCGSWKESVGTVDRGAVELAIGGGGGEWYRLECLLTLRRCM
jgi:hypothetical protein